MQINDSRKTNISISETMITQEFDEIKVPLTNKRLYHADAVDSFLTKTSSDVEQLEKASQRLLQFYEKNKKGRVAESNSGPNDDKDQVDEVEMTQILKAKDQRMDRMQKHMAALFEDAENKAELIVGEAELEKDSILDQAKIEAERIISEAQKNADEISRVAEEKIQQAKLIKYELNERAQEVQSEIVLKANQLDEMTLHFTNMSQKLRGLVNEASAS